MLLFFIITSGVVLLVAIVFNAVSFDRTISVSFAHLLILLLICSLRYSFAHFVAHFFIPLTYLRRKGAECVDSKATVQCSMRRKNAVKGGQNCRMCRKSVVKCIIIAECAWKVQKKVWKVLEIGTSVLALLIGAYQLTTSDYFRFAVLINACQLTTSDYYFRFDPFF